MFFDLIKGIIADDVEPFEMICEEDLEVVVMGLMEGGVDIVVIRTGIRCVLHFEVLHEDEVLYHLHVLNLPVLPEERTDRLLTRLVQPRDIQLPHQDALMYLLGRLRLLHKLLLLGFWQFGEHLMHGQVVSDRVVPQSHSHLLVTLLHPALLVPALPRTGTRVTVPPLLTTTPLLPAALLTSSTRVLLTLGVVVPFTSPVLVGVGARTRPTAGTAFGVPAPIVVVVLLALIPHQKCNFIIAHAHLSHPHRQLHSPSPFPSLPHSLQQQKLL